MSSSNQILESTIEAVCTRFDTTEKLAQAIDNLGQDQPHIAAYLKPENHKLLTEEEYGLLWFMTVVVVQSYEDTFGPARTLSQKQIGEAEEQLWATMNEQKAKNFRDKLNVFFDQIPEEEILAFVEDNLIDDDDEIVSPAGREYLFVGCVAILISLLG